MTTRSIKGDPAPVTVLGLGPMGQALAAAFLAGGHDTTVWNRTAARAEILATRGATAAATPADAAGASPLVVVCVRDYAAVRAILADAGDALKGRTLVNLTADAPDRARELADWAAERGVDYLDGSIMSPVETIGGPQAVVLYSGPEPVYQAHRSSLASLGGTPSYLGADPGRAAAYDVALLDLFWTTMSGYAHALALARTQGIAARDLAPYALGIVGLMGGIIPEFAAEVDESRHPGDDATLVSAVAGMDHVIHAARAQRLDVGVLAAARAVAGRALAEGYGEDSFSRLTDVLLRSAAHR
ncbi:NAD(P)-dependent oxidoreductase [Plantactinospora soyae]|uniref:3-hydroxyisobutyrate dehydrogenase-like beta-hydroxyacid dehydrogenase n=1 Tax=Plantactinospora soyae TaxID=1544732 RepID=A0A927QWG1_9ACTN|nr:NAD(P)-binding domain-containing protein [Plantactinospora soyae]MBE1484408.1 3-hydroxyisobutyrate dehydrogenase-like beta-hydroxyacid dehydrogenase [Plantactinospora soyae]